MDVVQVVLESDMSPFNPAWVVDAGDNPPALLFRREPFGQDVHAGWDYQGPRLVVVKDRVRLACPFLRPRYEKTVEVARVDQRARAASGC